MPRRQIIRNTGGALRQPLGPEDMRKANRKRPDAGHIPQDTIKRPYTQYHMKKILTAVGVMLISAASMTALADNENTNSTECAGGVRASEQCQTENCAGPTEQACRHAAPEVPDSVPVTGWHHRGRRLSAERLDSVSMLTKGNMLGGRHVENVNSKAGVTKGQLREAVRSERQPKPKARTHNEQNEVQSEAGSEQ